MIGHYHSKYDLLETDRVKASHMIIIGSIQFNDLKMNFEVLKLIIIFKEVASEQKFQ